MGKPFQILALDGGGYKGLFSAQLLAHLERDLQLSVRDSFDLIVGTSAGGIVALGLGAGVAPGNIVGHYEALARAVFPRRRRINVVRRTIRPAYSPARLEAALHDVLGDKVLRDSDKRLVVPAYDVNRGAVHIFKTPHHDRFRRDGDVRMVDVALATSAAPTFFPAHRVEGARLVDGGVWANNPAVIAIAEAVSVLQVPLEDVAVLSIGTTDSVSRHPRRLDRGGWAQWATRAAAVVLTATSRGTNGTAQHLLGDRFVRFDAAVPERTFSIDRVDEEDLRGWASGVSRELGPVFRQHFADHVAPEYRPARPHHGPKTA